MERENIFVKTIWYQLATWHDGSAAAGSITKQYIIQIISSCAPKTLKQTWGQFNFGIDGQFRNLNWLFKKIEFELRNFEFELKFKQKRLNPEINLPFLQC